jgi:salicylate hydroxylase
VLWRAVYLRARLTGLQVGAGIQIPPNASRVLSRMGLLPSLQRIANEVKALKVRRYQDGLLLASRPVRWDTPWL